MDQTGFKNILELKKILPLAQRQLSNWESLLKRPEYQFTTPNWVVEILYWFSSICINIKNITVTT